MAKLRKQTLDGNVEMLLLAILESGPSYGYAIVEELKKRAEGLLELGEGTIYPVLHRMEEKEFISAYWENAESGRQRKYYKITPKGKLALAESMGQWKLLSSVMEKVVGSMPDITKQMNIQGEFA